MSISFRRIGSIGVLVLCLLLEAFFADGQAKKDTAFPKVDSLKAVIVRPKEIRMHIHGDTMEYNTASIRLRLNANVEELLTRLPGLHIDANGNITYNGEIIKQLLVDGEDLFGSDPTIITRNFDASKIAAIQVLDRKSDQARFTGLDDGSRVKTLNLVLKEDSKKGYLGKVEAGANTEGIYNTNVLIGSFRQKEQIAALGFSSNTGVSKFADGSGLDFGLSSLTINDDPIGTSAGKGIPTFHAIALHYANTWEGEGKHLIGNYQFNNLYTRPVTETNTVQTLPDSVYIQHGQAQSANRQDQHWSYGNYEWKIDNRSAIKASFRYNSTISDNQYGNVGSSLFNDTLVNRSSRTAQSTGNLKNLGGGFSWRIQSARNPARIFAISTDLVDVNTGTDGKISSVTDFYKPDGSLKTTDTVDQRKKISNHTKGIFGGVNLVQPLWGKTKLSIRYTVNYSNDDASQYTYDKGDGKYQELVDSLSSHLISHTLTHRAALYFQGVESRINYLFSLGGQYYTFDQKDWIADTVLRYRYLNFAPSGVLTYNPNGYTRISLNYLGSMQQPSAAQLQPIKNNNDPLHLVLGNSNLKPSFNQNLNLSLTGSRKWLYSVFLSFNLISNSISTRTTTDSLGRQISQLVNVDGGRNAILNLLLNKKIAGFDFGMMTSFTYGRNVNYINADLSQNDSYMGSGGFKMNQYVPDKYSFQIETKFSYFDNQSSINTSAPIHYWAQNHTGTLTLFFIPGIELSSNASYSWQQKTIVFAQNTSVILWNASIGHNFLSGKLAARLLASNLLNQNSGITRTNSGNVNTESFTNILGRYWLLSLAWRFDHKYKRK